ncbi:hypothetical protein ACIA5H_02940 [Nocardia sp. NPDC051900]|uniref:hypothetical protein n=1 Tax=Nocardia sp. NPDC051900 TaxID=3364326 RepID=UPI0037B729F6
MTTPKLTIAAALRPPRLNYAGFCIYCLAAGCSRAGCIAQHAASEWVLCPDCGGTGYVRGHIDPVCAHARCDCWGGLLDVNLVAPEPVAVVSSSGAEIGAAWDRFDSLFGHEGAGSAGDGVVA